MIVLLALVVFSPAHAADLDLSPYRGKVVYVDFWASWCGPCRESFPWLDELVRQYGRKDLVVIGVNVDKDRARAQRFLSAMPADFPIVYDPKGDLAASFKISGMPSAVLIDRTGHIRFQHAGFSAKQRAVYEEQVQSLIAEGR